MSGWIALAVLLAAAFGLLWVLRVRGAMLQLSAAALLFAGAGYASQGRPSLDSAPASAAGQAAPIPLTTLRHAFFGNFSGSEHWLRIAESYARRGQTQEAAGVLRSAVREHPRNAALWVGLGNALADHAGMLTPASHLAFERAAELAPGHPAPPFFFGLALARSGEPEAALALWRSVLAQAPADASWRPYVEDAIRAVEPRGQAPRR
jgi:tetratricopeptide (TPR) repeat protein